MTTLVAIYDTPALGLRTGDVVTDDSSVVAANPNAILKASAYVAGLLTGNYAHALVPQGLSGGVPTPPSPVDLFVASTAQAIVNLAATSGFTAAQIIATLQAQIGGSAPVDLTGNVPSGAALGGSATTQAPNATSLSGAVAGGAALTGAISKVDSVSGVIPGGGTLGGSMTAQAPGTAALSGSIPGSANLSGALSSNDNVSGNIAGSASLLGGLSASDAASGTVPGSATLAGSMSTSAATYMADFSNPANSQYAAALAA